MEIKNFTITKRDGSKDSFSLDKIMNAIVKAFESVNVPSDLGTISKIISHLDIKDDITVEDIQNQVEEALMREGFYKVAKSFMLYRQQHTEDRETLAKLQFLSDYMESANAATSSKFDANANVEHKNIATLIGELPKSNFIRLNRRLLTERIKKMYDKELADKYIDLLTHHFIYKNDETSLANYCASITMYPWLIGGTTAIGGNSTAPTNLKSFAGGFINMVFMVSSMLAGACATPEFLMYMNYFIGKEYGKDYWQHPDQQADLSLKKRTIDKVITDYFEQIVYSLNQPTGARNYQAVFWNVAYYDRYYFESIFGEFYFPDGSKPDWDGLSWLQKRFMKWFNQERTKTLLTFPVETMALLVDENGEPKDKEWGEFTAEMYAEGHSFFTYMSDNADSLSFLLPSAQRDYRQRLLLYAGCWWCVYRFEVGAHHQPQPLRAVCRQPQDGLSGVPRSGHRPLPQGTAGLQREPQGPAGSRHAAPVRCWLHQHRPPVPHHRYQRSR